MVLEDSVEGWLEGSRGGRALAYDFRGELDDRATPLCGTQLGRGRGLEPLGWPVQPDW